MLCHDAIVIQKGGATAQSRYPGDDYGLCSIIRVVPPSIDGTTRSALIRISSKYHSLTVLFLVTAEKKRWKTNL